MKGDMQIVIGLGGSNHDGSAALLRGSSIEVAVEQERVTRRKHGLSWWWENPVGAAVDYCLEAAGVGLDEVVRFVSSDLLPRRVSEEYWGITLRLFPHHLCHAASACMLLPPGTRAAVLVYDGMGSIRSKKDSSGRVLRETFGFFQFDEAGLICLGETFGESLVEHDDFPSGCSNSIGKIYEMATAILGFDEFDAGKTMGLAAHGEPRYADAIESFVSFGDNFSACLRYDASDPSLRDFLRGVIEGSPGFAVKADVAASVQAVLEKTLLHAFSLFAGVEYDVFCVVGGCALNSVANGALAQRLPRGRRLLVPPFAADAGLGFGALWLDRQAETGALPIFTLRGRPIAPAAARPGRLYGAARCRAAARRFYPRLAHDPRVHNAQTLAAELAAGRVIGLFNGPSEIGPRALGGRSILADPRSAAMRERINRTLKLREPFRPLAPMILEERYGDFFEDPRRADPYMLRVAYATERCRTFAPAVVHVDGTARVQTVGDEDDPFLLELLRAFEELTRVPVLLNTSFNRRGEPIVETPEDALDAFLSMGLDGLYMDGVFFVHPNASATERTASPTLPAV
jgi:carbamoyltransferase